MKKLSYIYQLLPLVYQELRKLAAAKLADEKPGQTLQATALVHDAYLRLVDAEKAVKVLCSSEFLSRQRMHRLAWCFHISNLVLSLGFATPNLFFYC